MHYWDAKKKKRLEKKLDGNFKRILRIILNKSWRQHPAKHQLYGPLPPITKTIKVRRTRHARHCWRSRNELISDVLLWTPKYGRAKAGRPARTYIQQLLEDTGCSPEDLPEAMSNREKERERVRDIHAGSTMWWWWFLICAWQCWVLSKEASTRIFWVFVITRPGIELRSSGTLVNTLPTRQMGRFIWMYIYIYIYIWVSTSLKFVSYLCF